MAELENNREDEKDSEDGRMNSKYFLFNSICFREIVSHFILIIENEKLTIADPICFQVEWG